MIPLILYLVLLFSLLFFLIFMSVYTLSLIYSSFKGAPYVPTKMKVLEQILIPAKLNKNSFLMELGSGDGRMLIFASKRFGVRGLGVDINPLLVFWSNIWAKQDKVEKRISFRVKNIFNTDLSPADCVYIFLMPELIEKLTEKMEKELKKNTMVIAHGFPVKRWKKKLVHTLKQSPFPTYYYRV